MTYFDFKEVGLLKLEKVLLFLDTPRLFICTDSNGNRYTCLCVQDDPEERYIVVESATRDIVSMLSQQTSMQELFLRAVQQRYWDTNFDDSDVHLKAISEIPEAYLPTENALFLVGNKELRDYRKGLAINQGETKGRY